MSNLAAVKADAVKQTALDYRRALAAYMRLQRECSATHETTLRVAQLRQAHEVCQCKLAAYTDAVRAEIDYIGVGVVE